MTSLAALRKTLFLTLVALALAPAAALAHPQPQVLRDVPPVGDYFRDAVLSSSPKVAHAALSGVWHSYALADGGTISAAISDQYGGTVDTSVVQSYVDFLDSLPHGAELSTLRVFIAPPDEVLTECGGAPGTLACYDSGTKIMVVPGEQSATASQAGVTTSYVITHEYGHHIAASRNNAPFNAFRFGPKYWASDEMVCDRTTNGLLFPGDEGAHYNANPGELWAETYAHLKYPDVPWTFATLLQPDQAAFDAATKDVLQPWTGNKTQIFTGTFGKRGSSTKRFSFDLTLDGSLSIRLKGPRTSNYNLFVSSNGKDEGSTKAKGSRDSLSYQAACRQSPLEHVTVGVKRVTGSGPFTVRVSYAG